MAEQEITKLSLERYTPEAKALIVETQALADAAQHAEVTPLHLLSQCLSADPAIAEVFRRAGASLPELQSAVESSLGRQGVSKERAFLSTLLLDLMRRAEREAFQRPGGKVGVEHLLNALAQEVRGQVGEILGAFQLGPGSLRTHLGALRSMPKAPSASDPAQGHPVLESYAASLVDKAQKGEFGPMLGRGSELRRVLTILERRQKHHPLLVGETGVGKATLIRGLAQRVAQGDVPATLKQLSLYQLDIGALLAGTRLRGELEGRARKLLAAVAARADGVLVILGLEQVYSSSSQLTGLADLLRSALDRRQLRLLCTTTPEGERRIVERDPLLYQSLTRLFVREPSDTEAMEIVRGSAGVYEHHHGIEISEEAVRCAVTLAKRYVSERALPDSAFDLLDESAASKRVEVDGTPPDLDTQLRRLESVRAQLHALEGAADDATLEARAGLQKEASSLTPIVEERTAAVEKQRSARALLSSLRAQLSDAREQATQARRADDLARLGELTHVTIVDLEERLQRATETARALGVDAGPTVLSGQDVAATLAEWTGVPVAKMLEAEAEKLSRMEDRLRQRVVGQDLALARVAKAVRRSRVGLRDPRRPIGSFLFLGPSGVGKTELAKALAEFLFDDEQALTRLDMSEYMERHMAQRLLGAPPGYADSERGGVLTEAVRNRPYSVLLFDEVEKAHQDVFNLLLQVLDDGRLTDGRGRLTDFTNTVVILTSNIGSAKVVETDPEQLATEEGFEQVREVLQEELREFFRPEFLNRIGDVVVFGALTREHLSAVLEIQLRRVQRLLDGRNLSLVVSDEAKQRLVELGYEPSLGARPLERVLVQRIQDPVAEGLLSGQFPSGSQICVEVHGEGVRVHRGSSS